MIKAVFMAGGSGTPLWPLFRAAHPKQFLALHALENIGDTPLELIKVQVGSYLGEDDIVRFDDVYGRVVKLFFDYKHRLNIF